MSISENKTVDRPVERQVFQVTKKEDEYTPMPRRQSRVPEIVKLGKASSVAESDYWTDNWDTMECLEYFKENFKDPQMSSTLNNIESFIEYADNNVKDTENCWIPSIIRSDNKYGDRKNSEHVGVNFPASGHESKSFLSSRLTYTREETFPVSSNSLRFTRKQEKIQDLPVEDDKIHKYKINRPPDLKIPKDGGSEYSFERGKSNPPILSSKTPVEPRCDTPSTAIILDLEQKKMAVLLQRFGLTRFIFAFLSQEVDLDLFLTLNDQDLWEIGIKRKSDRNVLLSVIAECNRYNM